MASPDNDNAAPPIPGFSPMGKFDAQQFLEGLPTIVPAQICPETTVFNDRFTPPLPSRVHALQSNHLSLMSLLTGGASASTSAPQK